MARISTGKTPTPSAPKKRSKLKYILGAAVIGGAAWLLWPEESEPPPNYTRMGAEALDHFENRRFLQAYELAQIAAPNGSADGQHVMGLLHARGYVVQQNMATATEWFGQAATQGNEIAMVWLGHIYMNGTGNVDDDLCLAREWLLQVDIDGQPAARAKEDAFNLLYTIGVENPGLTCP